MNNSKKSLVIPILMITVGVGWLLTVQGFAPGINWVWTLGMAVVGLLTFVWMGFNKVSVVIGPFFLLGSLLSVLRQTGRLSIDSEVPILVILLGVLLLVVRSKIVPVPTWFVTPDPPKSRSGS